MKPASTIGQNSSGRSLTYRSPSRNCPFSRAIGSVGRSSLSRMASSPPMTAAKDSAFTANAQPLPTAAISRPATAGPTSRAVWKLAAFRLTALARCFGPTISETKACRAGLSTTVTRPSSRAKA